MTRDEEFIVEAQKHGLNCMSRINYQDGFIDGAKWADKTMIEKACSILEDMTDGKLGKRFISEFKNKLKYGILERH